MKKKLLVNGLKLGCSAAIIAYLVHQARQSDSFAELWQQPKDWGLLAAASLTCLAMVMLTFVRWYVLVRALELPFRLADAFRLGFLGYLLNFFSLGSVGGDLFKAVFIAREQPGRRAEAVATVVIDRLIGLYALFLVAAAATLLTGLIHSPVPQIQLVGRATLIGSGLGAIVLLVLLMPGFTRGSFSSLLCRLPRLGRMLAALMGAARVYRGKRGVLALTGAMSVGVHALGALGIYLIARGLGGNFPSLGDHFVVVPLGMLAAVLPLPLSGLGAFEAVIEFLYVHIPDGGTAKGSGLIVAVGYRLVTILIAIVGLFYYLASRREVESVLRNPGSAAIDTPPAAPALPEFPSGIDLPPLSDLQPASDAGAAS